MKKLLLVDGNSLLFRAYYSTIYSNALSTSTGIPTNAVFGFITMMNKAMQMVEPDAVLVAWDAAKKTFRTELMETYKGNRPPLDDELAVQMPIVREYLDEAGYTRYEQQGYEADDIIGSMAASAENMETVILTGDKDLLQLVNPNVTVMMMKKGLQEVEMMDEKAIYDRYKLTPKQIIDLKGLMGDPSDNIPGVKGVGEKTALLLLEKYQSVEGVYEHIDEIKGKRKENLVNGKDSAFLSKELATIFTQMQLPFSIADLEYKGETENVNSFYEKYEMRSLLNRLGPVKEAKKDIKVTRVKAFMGEPNADLVLMPVASDGSFMEQTLFGFAYPWKDEIHYLDAKTALADEEFLDFLKNDKTIQTWDVKETLHLLDRNGFPLPSFAKDIHLAAFLLYSQATSNEALIEACQIELPTSLRDLAKKTLGGWSEERAIPVFGAMAAQLDQVSQRVFAELEKESMQDLYEKVEFPLAEVLFKMECQGISISDAILHQIGDSYNAKMNEIAQEIYMMAGHSFNIGSPKQLAAVLFDELKLTGSGKKRSTAADVLEKLKAQHPIIEKILEYRMYSKIVSTYVEGLSKYIINGKIYTTFNQTMTQTGRLSSSDPNLQNISIRSAEGREIRKAFVAPEGYSFISADYSQVELRMLAHMADEQFMIQAFEQGIDIHNRTATIIFGVQPDEVTDEQRRVAKTVNFAIIYGQTEFGLSQELKVSRATARDFIEAYFANYPNIHRFMDGEIEFCEQNGYVETLLKRRRAIPEINDKNFMTREFGKRAAMNAPVQGSAADLIKLAMIKMDKVLQEKQMKSKMILQIHDELIFLVPDDELETMKQLVPATMDSAMELKVPLEASTNAGRTWYEAK